MEWRSVRKEAFGTIMKTDIVCEIVHTDADDTRALICLEEVFGMFRDFGQRYSRFVADNELWQMNMSESIAVSEELFDMLRRSKGYYERTGGLFDPSILPVMEASGYTGAYGGYVTETKDDFSQVMLDAATRTVTKPKGLMIDLGGIGKGFAIDKAVRFLSEHFENFMVDAGGDIAVRGVNAKEGYPYWAIDIEHPQRADESVALLLLRDAAVATSGRNRRHWTHQGRERHHIIDPSTRESAASDLLSVTVIAPHATKADVFAKTLFIAGKKKGMAMSEILNIPAVFVDKDGIATHNHYMETYVWKP
ncbi:MAG: FAD:protein FMN transferase [Candidatus Moranbacteria bacterium]|nr:FAD:protein FMN transferase [Candidatus Moranbacteria bacterium]